MAYGSRVRRHGKSRAFSPYQAKTASCIASVVIAGTGAGYRPARLLRTRREHADPNRALFGGVADTAARRSGAAVKHVPSRHRDTRTEAAS
jgi:predicted protein tyrosine phosphatase